jgi:hypothetical protein
MEKPIRSSKAVIFSSSLLVGALLGSLATVIFLSGVLTPPAGDTRHLRERIDILCMSLVAGNHDLLVERTRKAIAVDNELEMHLVLQCTDDPAGLMAEAIASKGSMKRG